MGSIPAPIPDHVPHGLCALFGHRFTVVA
jgi:hypothetical protein